MNTNSIDLWLRDKITSVFHVTYYCVSAVMWLGFKIKGEYSSTIRPKNEYSSALSSEDHEPKNEYSFALRPEDHQPSGVCDFSKIYGTSHLLPNRDKNKFYFNEFSHNTIEHKRKYVNDWSDLKKFADLDDIELFDNELTIVNLPALIKEQKQQFFKRLDRMSELLSSMSGMGGLSYFKLISSGFSHFSF